VVAAVPVSAGEAEPVVEFVPGDHKVDVRIGGKLFTSYRYADDLPKPALYPVDTPAATACSPPTPLGQGVFEEAWNPGRGKPLQLTLRPGEKAHFRYRVLVYDGRKTPRELEALYKEFAD
jgi:hypothetical protein